MSKVTDVLIRVMSELVATIIVAGFVYHRFDLSIEVVFAIVATVAGLGSAIYWLRSSLVRFDPKGSDVFINSRITASVDDVEKLLGLTATLNANAAIRAAIAVAASTLSVLV